MPVKLYKKVPGEVTVTEIPFLHWLFPAGEVGVKLNVKSSKTSEIYLVKITGKVNLNNCMVALQLNDSIRSQSPQAVVKLYCPYFPYARQDRYFSGESKAVNIFASILASKHWDCVLTLDLHSDSAFAAALEAFGCSSFVNTPQGEGFLEFCENKKIEITPELTFVAPDKGASTKIYKVAKNNPVLILEKSRTGIGEVLHCPPVTCIKGSAIIVDDICDGGATFLSAARTLRSTQPELDKLYLYVSHGIFSKGLEELSKRFDKIMCYNLMSEDPSVLVGCLYKESSCV